MRTQAVICLLAACLAAWSTSGDTIDRSGCTEPMRPPHADGPEAWNAFMDKVDAYRECVTGFAERNHAAADAHRSQANAATEQWNAFVRRELNVREDFPWPLDEAAYERATAGRTTSPR